MKAVKNVSLVIVSLFLVIALTRRTLETKIDLDIIMYAVIGICKTMAPPQPDGLGRSGDGEEDADKYPESLFDPLHFAKQLDSRDKW